MRTNPSNTGRGWRSTRCWPMSVHTDGIFRAGTCQPQTWPPYMTCVLTHKRPCRIFASLPLHGRGGPSGLGFGPRLEGIEALLALAAGRAGGQRLEEAQNGPLVAGCRPDCHPRATALLLQGIVDVLLEAELGAGKALQHERE